MLFDIKQLTDKFDAISDFIPVKIAEKDTFYINKNAIIGFTVTKECLNITMNHNIMPVWEKPQFPKQFTICKEDNPVAYNELLKN